MEASISEEGCGQEALRRTERRQRKGPTEQTEMAQWRGGHRVWEVGGGVTHKQRRGCVERRNYQEELVQCRPQKGKARKVHRTHAQGSPGWIIRTWADGAACHD